MKVYKSGLDIECKVTKVFSELTKGPKGVEGRRLGGNHAL